jgi:predicted homoserine dehydrogenase-like protein
MIIVDRALDERAKAGNPIRVGMIGAGFMGRGIARQILTAVPGMRLVAIANRTLDKAREAYSALDEEPTLVDSEAALSSAISEGRYAITDDPLLLARQPEIEAIIEVTGAVEDGVGPVLTAIEHGKHVILMNAELDGTVGPILKTYADHAGVVYTNADGDQPGVQLNLFRFVQAIGVRPVLCGNIKGLHDPYRNPTTQEGFAKQWGQNPWMVTSFADGTKISFEQAIVANATGMRVAKRGMHGPTVETGTHVDVARELFSVEELTDGPGIVDYVVGAVPSPGVFALGTHDDRVQQHYLNLYKLGEGPLYSFYTPWHLCHFEVPITVARAVLFSDAAIAPLGAPLVDVVAAAKVDLEAGQELDALGGYTMYGLAENADVSASERLLPLGLAPGCRLTRDVAKDEVLTYDDVDIPDGRLVDRLRAEQNEKFAAAPA